MSDSKSISPAELKKRLDERKVEFLFDLRNEDEFKAWRIEGREDFPVLNIPQIDFVVEEGRYLNRFPKDKEIIAVCAHGDSSRYEAELLTGKGFNAVNLEGGMDAWSEYYEIHKASDSPDIYQIYRTARGCMCHVIVSNNEAVVIDPSRHIEKIIALTDSLGAKITHVIDTHLHADHISGVRDLALKAGAKFFMNPIDAEGATFKFEPLTDGMEIRSGDNNFLAIHTPGHTPGITSLLLNGKHLFTGDTIMKTDMGRPDLGGKAEEWAGMLYNTLFNKLKKLGDDIIILPSHADSIKEQNESDIVSLTLGEARRNSKLFTLKDDREFIMYILESLPENPDSYQEIRKANLGIISPDEAKKKELEIGKNLCVMKSSGEN
ncbi:MAG: MBL fold metallo-hydrolase [Thermodesulfovibrionia bacterium]|nr:MBL fold metallo-hydrolase [Thermodesulfovibrionia bacterium]